MLQRVAVCVAMWCRILSGCNESADLQHSISRVCLCFLFFLFFLDSEHNSLLNVGDCVLFVCCTREFLPADCCSWFLFLIEIVGIFLM